MCVGIFIHQEDENIEGNSIGFGFMFKTSFFFYKGDIKDPELVYSRSNWNELAEAIIIITLMFIMYTMYTYYYGLKVNVGTKYCGPLYCYVP